MKRLLRDCIECKKPEEPISPILQQRTEVEGEIWKRLDPGQKGGMARLRIDIKVMLAIVKFKSFLKENKRQSSVSSISGILLESRKDRKKRKESVRDGRMLLTQRLNFLHLDSKQMMGDGNCQFRSFSHELYGTQDHHMSVRSKVVTWMIEHKESFEVYVGDGADWNEYIKLMKRSKNWGDELTLKAFADCFKVTVHVITTEKENYHLDYKPEAPLGEGEGGGRRAFLSYISPVHYNVVCLPPSSP